MTLAEAGPDHRDEGGEKDRVGTLRYVLSELQKAAKEGSDDEPAVLRRERKRRQESATAFARAAGTTCRRRGGRGGRHRGPPARGAVGRGAARIRRDAVVETGATGMADMGRVMRAAMEQAGGRADGRRVSALAQEALKAPA